MEGEQLEENGEGLVWVELQHAPPHTHYAGVLTMGPEGVALCGCRFVVDARELR